MGKCLFLKRTIRSFLTLGLCSFLFISGIHAADAPIKNGEEPIAPGVVRESYHWGTSYGNIIFEVLRCNLTDPYLDLRLVAGQGEYNQKATVPAMAQRTSATAMLNGDFFNMLLEGAPIGPSIINGQLASSPADIQGIFSLGITSDNTASIEAMAYNGKLTAADGASFPIDGLNKTYYWHDPSGAESHTNLIQMYNDMWASSSRGHATNSEVLVNAQGVVEQISYGKTFPFSVPDGKTILQVNGKAETFIKQHCPIGSKVTIHSQVIPDKKWKFLVGGHALVVDQGHMVPYTKDLNALAGIRARTAAGVSADGKTLWFVCAEGRTNRSAGAQLSTLGYFMQYLGAYRAVNLDGGGSTTMVLKHYGENTLSTVIAPEGNGWLRPVVNGIGIYNSAPLGEISSFETSGPTSMVVGETVKFGVGKAVDEYFHPITANPGDFTISSDNGYGASSGLYYLGLKTGTEIITFTHHSGLTEKRTIQIQGAEGFKNIFMKTNQFMVSNGAVVRATLYGTKRDGQVVMLDPRVATWQLDGFEGTANAGTITVSDTNDFANGQIIAQIGNLKAEAWLGNNEYNLLDLYIGDNTYWLNGETHTVDQPPIATKGRTLVPIRLVTEALGGDVQWIDKDTPITISYKDHHIELMLDSTDVIVDGEKCTLDVPAQVKKNRILLPIRFISEHLGMAVTYDQAKQCVSVCGLK